MGFGGLGPVVWGLLSFLGLGSLYKHKIINLEKKCCLHTLLNEYLWFRIAYIYLWLLRLYHRF